MKYTFGKTVASKRLEKLLEGNPIAHRKVSRLLSTYSRTLFNITGAKDPETVLMCMELLREYTLKRVDKQKNLPPEICSYVKNLIVSRYRLYRKSFEALIPALRKMIAQEKGLTSGEDGV